MFAETNQPVDNTAGVAWLVGEALREGDFTEAEQLLRNWLLRTPGDVGATTKLADLLLTQGKTSEAIAQLRRALAVAPLAHQLRLQLSLVHQRLGQFSEALALVEELPEPLRRTNEVKIQEAALLGQLGQREQEISLYKELLRELPRNIRLWLSLGQALNYVGRPTEAARALRRAIKIAPSNGEPWWALANLKSSQFDKRDLGAMRRALRQDTAVEDAIHIQFALGRALEERQEYAQSFEHYREGNRMSAAAFQPEQMRVTDFVDEAIATFDQNFFNRCRDAGCRARDPIFIIGLQRSGSTLIEQILASHPQIEGTTELLAMQHLSGDLARNGTENGRTVFQQIIGLQPDAFRRIGEEYLERTKAFRLLDRPMFVDKLPANWLNVGLIRLALPNAKIIDARRHPMACGFSNFKQLYAHGVTYSYSMPSIGRFYRDYLRLMAHFDDVQPGAIHHVVNEQLIDNPEKEIRRLLVYLELPFDSACLDFHRNRRAVNTPSASQVRRPINRDGVDAWFPYAQWLEPLREELGPLLNRWLPIIPLSRASPLPGGLETKLGSQTRRGNR